MFKIEEVLFLDTETTGLPEKGAQWDVDFETYPHVVQIAWKFGDREKSYIIRPDGWTIPDDVAEIHGITTEYATEVGKPFPFVVSRLLEDCRKAGLICGHNIHFDTSILKANILRELGREYYDAFDVEESLHKGKRIDTMRSSMKWVDARTMDGRLKFPNLTELYSRCFPGEMFPAHDALADVGAVARCLPVLVEKELVKLERKEYPDVAEEARKAGQSAAASLDELSRAAKIASDVAKKLGVAPETDKNGANPGLRQEDDKIHGSVVKAAPADFSEKITDLLNQSDF